MVTLQRRCPPLPILAICFLDGVAIVVVVGGAVICMITGAGDPIGTAVAVVGGTSIGTSFVASVLIPEVMVEREREREGRDVSFCYG